LFCCTALDTCYPEAPTSSLNMPLEFIAGDSKNKEIHYRNFFFNYCIKLYQHKPIFKHHHELAKLAAEEGNEVLNMRFKVRHHAIWKC